jgi:hypothetical protein
MSKVFDSQEFIFIDTPEFEYDTSAKKVLLNNMKLVSKIPTNIIIAGVIYIDSSEPSLPLEFEHEFLSWLLAFCGLEFLSQLTLIITDDDSLEGSTCENYEQYLERWKKSWAPLFTGEARAYHYRTRSEDSRIMTADYGHTPSTSVAENLIRGYANLLRQTRQTPQFCNEIASGVLVEETKAARVLYPAEVTRPEPFGLIEDPPRSDLQSLDHVPPELLPDMLFSSLVVQPTIATRCLPTAAPCPICNNFTTYVSKISTEEARCRASAGCLGCRLITCAYEKLIREGDRDWPYRRLEPENTFQEGTQETGLTASISASSATIKFASTLHEYEIFTTAEVHTSRGPFGRIRQGRIPFENSGSPESFDLISTWMRDCCSKHGDCPSTEAQLPSRVLDINCSKGIKLRSSAGLVGHYCALSHCWGSSSNNPVRTTIATLASHQSKIEEGSLSKSFREAIALARHLSIQYIWIDSLCIIQDDPEDWAKESANMASIYQNAYLVIAATQAEHSGIGCFSARFDKSTLCFEIPQVNGQDAPVYIRTKTNHLHFNPNAMYNANPDSQHPLLSRAWCFQERLLATRLIHFAREELVWECRTETRCECGTLHGDRGNDYAFKRRWAVDRELGKLFDLWHKTLHLYNSLHITYELDRLPALSGLAKQLQDRGCGEYVAGVWKKNIFADLMWHTWAGPRPKKWAGPSWSAACSGTRDVYFHTQNDNSPEALMDVEKLRGPHHPSKTPRGKVFRTDLVSVDYELNGADRTGKLNTATLTISAPTADVLLVRYPDLWKLEKAGRGLEPCLDDPDDFEIRETSLLCVWVGTIWENSGMHPQILLLQPSRGFGGKAAASGCYERVGVLRKREDTSTLLEWFKDAEVHCIKIV